MGKLISSNFFCGIIFILMLGLSGSASAALALRSLGGGVDNAVYDDVLDITWLADANLAASNTFGVTGIRNNGSMIRDTALSFIAAMNADNGGKGYLGVNSWRLPTMTPLNGINFRVFFTFDGSTDRAYQVSAPVDATYNPNGKSPGFTGNELAYHYYNNLGGIGACSGENARPTNGCVPRTVFGIDDATNLANLALFSTVQNGFYWSDIAYNPGSGLAFLFNMDTGSQDLGGTSTNSSVWAVTSGDVAAVVPLPASLWFLATGLASLFFLRSSTNS